MNIEALERFAELGSTLSASDIRTADMYPRHPPLSATGERLGIQTRR